MENRAAVRAYLKKYFQTRSIGSGKKGKGMTMKNRQKKVLALLLAGAMMALPVSQAFAETSYDASAGVEQQVLFPKDGLTGITAGRQKTEAGRIQMMEKFTLQIRKRTVQFRLRRSDMNWK